MLLRPVEKAWRGFGVGFFLAVLGLGGTLMALTLFPLAALTSRDPERRRKRIQRMIQLSFRLYCTAIRVTRVADVELAGIERLRGLRGTVIIGNHPSLLDVVMIMSVAPDVQCVVNGKLWRNPFLRLTVEGAGYIRNDLPADEFMEACTGALQSGANLVIFPEGTRTRPGQPIRFRRGFANIATLAEADLQLVEITCDPPILFKGNPWWRVPDTRTRFRMEVGDRVAIHSYLKYRWRSLGARRLVADLENYYAGKFGHGRPGAQAQDLDRELVEA